MKLFLQRTAMTLALLGQATIADELIMKNGSRLIGTVVSAGGGTVVLDTPFAGDISQE